MGRSLGKRDEHLPPGRSLPVSKTVVSYFDWRCWAQDRPAIPPPIMAHDFFEFDEVDDIFRTEDGARAIILVGLLCMRNDVVSGRIIWSMKTASLIV